MSKLISKRTGIALIILVVALLLGIYFESRPQIAAGQKPLTDVQTIETLRTQFNRDVGKTRLIILISPT